MTSKKTPVQYLFKMSIKGTALKGIFNYQKTIITSGISKWHISISDIKCSEINDEGRILYNYRIDGKNLLEYFYNFPTENHILVYEIHELVNPMTTMKISDILKMYITSSDPNIIHIHIIDREQNISRKKIYTQIIQDVVITQAPDIYSKMPVNIDPDVFHTFIRNANANKEGEFVKIEIQSPNYFCIVSNTRESQSHGMVKPKKAVYTSNFFINEIKNITKLLQSTNILNIYEPINNTEIAPLCIKGAIKLVGDFEIYIHNSTITPNTKT